jgi:hypothetical protein
MEPRASRQAKKKKKKVKKARELQASFRKKA